MFSDFLQFVSDFQKILCFALMNNKVICAAMGTDRNHPPNVTVKVDFKINELQPVLSAPSHKTVFHRVNFMNLSG